MPYEVGGRADKLGNRYEGRWVVKQLLRTINEEISYIVVEAIGPEEEGVDVWVYNKDGSRECQQCKGRNGTSECWNIGDLNGKGILKKSKTQLDNDNNTTYALVSPLTCTMLVDLHQRAITGDNAIYFYEYQVKNSSKEFITYFKKYCNYMGIDLENGNELTKVHNYLQRTQYYQYADDINEKRSILDRINMLFIGNNEVVYSLLSEYSLECDLLGKQITSNMILSYLTHKGIVSRNLALDKRILPRINTLNEEFKESFSPVNNVVLDRDEVKECLDEIEKGNSIVIHGKAGSGKSGCVYGIIKELEKMDILSLSLKLDRRVPNGSAQQYGESLDLPTSPTYCLHELSRAKRSVLILDQLDAIRWTNSHSSTAIEVCKEIIRQIEQLNRDRKKNISIIFVCRTYDYFNDKGIQSLFPKNDDTNKIIWKEITVGELSDNVVKDIVGSSYIGFSGKMKNILKIINNLYIWSQLDEDRKLNEIKSSTDLIKSWWEQLIVNYENDNSRSKNLNELKNEIVLKMENSGKLIVPETIIVRKYSPEPIQYLRSQGLLKINSKNIMFVHQSFFDYFLVEKLLSDLYEGVSILEVIGEPNKQTPMRRYQIQMLLQVLQDEDFELFINLCEEIMENENIRFYMKYVYLEVLGQSNIITKELEGLLKKYLDDSRYNEYFYETVFRRNDIFVIFLINQEYITKWLGDNEKINLAIDLIESVCEVIQDQVIEVITPLLFKDKETDHLLYKCLPREILNDSDEMFLLRISILEIYPELIPSYFKFKEFSKKHFRRSVVIIKLIVDKCNDTKIRSDLDGYVEDIFEDIENIEIEDGKFVIELLLSLVPESSDRYDNKLYGWSNVYGKSYGSGRACVAILKKAMKFIIENEVETFISLLDQYENCNSIIINEIVIESIIYLPETFADKVLKWIISGGGCHLLNKSGNEEDQLLHSKMILSKFSKCCDLSIFKAVEVYIVFFKEKDAIDTLRHRINHFKETGDHVYWSFWGEIQYRLLPTLYEERISNKTRDLIKVLERKFEGKSLKYTNLNGHSGSVQSIISQRAERLSNCTWKKIILDKKILDDHNSRFITTKEGFFETSIRQFAQTLEFVGKKNPIRFANLVLELPNEISDIYITSFLKIVCSTECEDIKEKNEKWSPVPIELAEKVIKKFRKDEEKSYDRAICWNVYKRSEEKWSKDIIKIISDIAINNSNPKESEVIVTNAEDKRMKTYDMLSSNSINCTRGSAAGTLGRVLWNDQSIYEDVKSAVESLINDRHPAVRMASIECLSPIYNIDREWAKEQIIGLFESDIRIVAHRNSHELVYLLYKDYKDRLSNIIKKMFYSQDKDVCRIGANYVCNLNILYDDFNELIFSKEELNLKQKNGIFEVAINLFDKEIYTDICKKILSIFINDSSEVANMYLGLFIQKKLIIKRDKEFILSLFKSNFTRRNIHYLVDFLQDTEESIIEFADVILELCRKIIINYIDDIKNNPYDYYGIEEELSKLIIGLYNESVNKDTEISLSCLDIWDQMFKYRVGSIRGLSKAIMEC